MIKRSSILLAVLLLAQDAQADPRPLSEEHEWDYYALHGGLSGAGFVVSFLEDALLRDHGPGFDLVPFVPDDLVRLNFSQSAAHTSDVFLYSALSIPLLIQMSEGFNTSAGNAALIYTQAHSLNLLLTTTAKHIVRRPRPYTHAIDSRIREFADNAGSDAYASFFSGHASSAHTAATAGAILYSARTDELWARHVVWGLEFFLAGVTAQLRVRAGLHYRTDIWVGSLVGMGVGVLVPALHRVELSRIKTTEIVTGAGAVAITGVVSEILDVCGILGALGLCELPRDVQIPVAPSSDTETGRLRWVVLPAAFETGGGLMASGEF